MKNQENKITANKRLAELLGWAHITEVGCTALVFLWLEKMWEIKTERNFSEAKALYRLHCALISC